MTDLTVSGFDGNLLALNGVYVPNGSQNHARPVYKNSTTTNQVVLMYFWDASNGPELHGWWLAPEVGSQQAWATGPPNAEMIPPTSGWRHPWNGPVDPKIQVGRAVKRQLENPQQQPQYAQGNGFVYGYQGYGQRFGGPANAQQTEYKTDDTELVAAEKALEPLTNELKEDPPNLLKALKCLEELEPLVTVARSTVQGGNVHPAWTARAGLVSQTFHSSRHQLENAIRALGEENVRKVTLMLKKVEDAAEKAKDDESTQEAVKLYKELTKFYDTQDHNMEVLFAAPHRSRPFAYTKHARSIRKLRDRLLKLGGEKIPARPETIEDVAERIREDVKGNDAKTANLISGLEAVIGAEAGAELAAVCGWIDKQKEIAAIRLKQKTWITDNLEKIKDATHPESAAVAARRDVLRSRDKSNLVDLLLTKLANKVKGGQNLLRLKIDDAIAAALRSRHAFQHTNEGPMMDILNSIGMPVTTEKLLDRYSLPELKKLLEDAQAKDIQLSKEWSLPQFRDLLFPAYMVVNPTNITTVFEVKTARAVEKLVPGHVVIQLDEPGIEEVGALRMRAASDEGNLGFVTLTGNQGTVFLKRYTGYFRVINEHSTVLRVKKAETENAEATAEPIPVPEKKAEETIKLKRTQILQAICHPKVNAIGKKATLSVRMDDGVEGEVTLCQGEIWFLEIVAP